MGYNNKNISDTVTEIVSTNGQRQSLIIVNQGDNVVYIGPDDSVTASNGIPLVVKGTLTEDKGSGRFYSGAVYGITSSGTSNVRYWERTSKI